MFSREDFVFTIGYDGPVAVVDKQAKRKYGRLSTRELAEKGLFRAAYSSAVYAGNPEELKLVADVYNTLVGKSSEAAPQVDLSSMERLFGVSLVEVSRAVYL